MYELNGKQYSQAQVEAAAKKSNIDVKTYIEKTGLKYIQTPIVETTGKELSQGQGAPVAENVAPENQEQNTVLQPENGSLEFPKTETFSIDGRKVSKEEFSAYSDGQEQISIEEKRNLPYNVRNYISSTTGNFSRNNIEKVINEIQASADRSAREKFVGSKEEAKKWMASMSNLKTRFLGEDGFGGEWGATPRSIARKIDVTLDQFLLNIDESAKDFEQWQMSHESQEDRDRVAKLADEKIQKRKNDLKQNYKELRSIKEELENLPVMTVTGEDGGKSFMNGIAKLTGSGATVAESVVPAMIAGVSGGIVGTFTAGPGAGTIGGAMASIAMSNSMMLSDYVTEYNITKAKSKNPDLNEEEALNKLIEDGESEFLKPAAAAVPAMGLEAVGIKGITKYFAARKGFNLGGLMWAANGEGLTESFQAPIEEYNKLIAQGVKPSEAVAASAQYFADNFAQTYIEAAAGTLVFSGLGRGTKLTGQKALRAVSSLRASVDGGKIEKTIDEIADLKIKQVNATTKQAREAIQLKIDDKQNELRGHIVQAASIMEFASEKNLEDISNLEDLKKTYAEKVADLDQDTMSTEEYLDTLEIYKEQYAEAKNRINSIAREVEIEKNEAPKKQQEASKKAQELYEKVVTNEAISERNRDKAKADIVSLFEGSVNRIVRKYSDRPGFNQMKEDLTSELLYSKSGVLGLIESYNKDKNNSLGAYVNSYLERRGIAIADKLLGKDEGSQFTTDVTESKTAMSEETADATIETREEIETAPKQEKLATKIKFDNKAPNLFSNTAKKVLSGKLPALTDAKAFKKELDNSFRTSLTLAMKNFSGTRKVYNEFLKNNWKVLYDAIPQEVINKRFPEFNRAVMDPKTGKQKRMNMQEGTAAGEPVFEKRTDVTQEEFLSYMNAPGSTKAARKNALAETLATQIGFDEVLEALADPEINKKFKEIQELQGFEVPENYGPRIAKIVNRLDQLADMLQRDPNKFMSSVLGGIELILWDSLVKAIRVFSAAIKKGATFLNAKKAFDETLQEDFYTQDFKDEYQKISDKYFKSEEDLNEASLKKFKKEIYLIAEKQVQQLGIEQGSIVTIKDRLSNKNLSRNDKKKLIADFIINENKSYSKFNDKLYGSYENMFKNLIEPILKDVAPEMLGEDGFSWAIAKNKDGSNKIANKKKGTFVTQILFDGKPLTDPRSKAETLFKNKNTEGLKNRRDEARTYFYELMDYYIESGRISQGLAHIKLLTEGTEGVFRSSGMPNIHVATKEPMRVEHNPPINSLFLEIAKAFRGEVPLQKVKDLLNKAHINYIPKSVDDILTAEGLQQSMPEGNDIYSDPYARMNNPKVVAAMKKYEKTTTILQIEGDTKTEQTTTSKETNFINEITDSLANETIEPVTEQEANSMSAELNNMVERKKGIPAKEIISKATAKLRGAKKGKMNILVPPSAEDFKGLVYALLGVGKQGEADMQFFEDKIFRPLARANQQLNTERQLVKTKWKNLVKNNKGILKTLRKESEYKFYNNDAAVRAWVWDKLGYEIPGIDATDKKGLLESVENDPKLLKFAEELINVPNSKESWLEPAEDWTASTIEMDLQDIVSKIGRARIFSEYIQNANIIFSDKNLNKLEAAYGPKYVEALKDMLYRIEKGKARDVGGNRLANAYLNWVRGAVGVTMFFNTRTALLQQLSIVNFTNWSDNNPIAQGKFLAGNPKLYAKYWTTIFNSDWMKERRQGLKTDINEAELAERMAGAKSPRKALLAYILEKGFVMTKYGDNFAVATGGAAFLYNREQTYIKKGMSEAQAKKEAFLDFQELAEQTQQSSRQDLLSNQQVSVIGRLFLAFQNTPMQMTRLTKKAMLDLVNGRGNKIENLARISYYSTIQSIIFSYMQSALFAAIFADDDDEEDEKNIDKKTERAINTVIDGFLRGTGVGGAVLATTKNAIIKWYKENDKDWGARSGAVLLELANISPPIGIKARKIYGAMENYKYNKKILDKIGYDNINHPMYQVATGLGSAAFNVPLDRVLTKMSNIKAMSEQDTEAWQRIALGLGYNTWDLGIKDPELEKARAEAKKKGVKVPKSKFSPSFKKFGKKFK
jgi:hypothetical protein